MEQEPIYWNLEDGDPCLRRATYRPDRGISCRQNRSPKLHNSRSRFYGHNRIYFWMCLHGMVWLNVCDDFSVVALALVADCLCSHEVSH